MRALFCGDRVDDPLPGDRVRVGDLRGAFALVAGAFDLVGDLRGDLAAEGRGVGRGGERSRFVV